MPIGVYKHKKHSIETKLKMSSTHKRNIANGTSKSVIFKKGNIPPFKGIKGVHLSPQTEFKKGIIPPNSYIFSKTEVTFKGTQSEYKSLHYRINKLLGQPDICEHCGKSGLSGKQIHWANKSGEYLENPNDWIRLCVKCHYKFDDQALRKIQI